MTKVIFPTDEHVPFQDNYARSVALQIAEDFKPDIRICGSDGIDFYSISRFDKNPLRQKGVSLQSDIDIWKETQREWTSAVPNADPFFIVGNHEDRLRRYLWRHPELADLELLTLPSLLGLPSLGIPWEKEKGLQANQELNLFDNLIIKHGSLIRKHSAYSAKAALEQEFYSSNVLIGHTHRGGTHYITNRWGTLFARECFCLCDLNPEYMIGKHPNWQQGIVMATVTEERVSVEPVPFYKDGDKTYGIWRDKEYVGT